MSTVLVTMFVAAVLAAPQPEPTQPPAVAPPSAHFLAGTPGKSPFARLFGAGAAVIVLKQPARRQVHGNCGMPVVEKDGAADPTFVRRSHKAGHIRIVPPPACGK